MGVLDSNGSIVQCIRNSPAYSHWLVFSNLDYGSRTGSKLLAGLLRSMLSEEIDF